MSSPRKSRELILSMLLLLALLLAGANGAHPPIVCGFGPPPQPFETCADDNGSGTCEIGGTYEGPFPEDAVYECTREHGYPPGVCIGDGFHTTAAIEPEDPEGSTYEGFVMGDWGDGISVEASSGDITARRCYGHDLHDDAFETDYAEQSFTVEECLLERVFMGFAYDRRSTADSNEPKAGWHFTIRRTLVELHRFTYAYKLKEGHGGLFKDDPEVAPDFYLTDNLVLAGPVMGDQVLFPNAETTQECARNVLLWDGTLAAWLDALDSGDSSDAPDNADRLLRLNQQFPGCFQVVLRPEGQSSAAFRAAHWSPRRDALAQKLGVAAG
jgi:hypothetical protein